MILSLKGTHGTTKSRAESILLSRNIHPAIGTRGHGSYFWRFNSFAEELGVCWHKKNLSEKRYDTDADKSCAVFTANIDVDENNFYNINAPEVADNILKLIQQNGHMNLKKTSKLYDIVVFNLEQTIKMPIHVFLTSVPAPKSDKYPWHMRSADCYVVKSKECITLKSVNYYNGRYIKCATVNL